MSQSTPRFTDADLPDPPLESSTITRLGETLRATAFWAAVALPVVYLPLLATAPEGQTTLFVTLLALNALALLVGHSHKSGDASADGN